MSTHLKGTNANKCMESVWLVIMVDNQGGLDFSREPNLVDYLLGMSELSFVAHAARLLVCSQ